MMRPIAFATALLAGSLMSGTAFACSDLNAAMAEFNKVKDAYVERAPTLKPDQFQVWAKHIQGFSTAMGKQDYAAACRSLEIASTELSLFGTAETGPTTPPPSGATPPPPPANTSTTTTTATPPPPPAATTGTTTATMPPAVPPATPPAPPAATAHTPPPATPPANSGKTSETTPVWAECPRGRCR